MYTLLFEAIPLTEARKNFLPLIKQVGDEHHKFIITRQGRPVAVVLSYEEYTRMTETLRLIQEVKKGLTDVEQGDIIDLENVGDE